MGGSRRSSVKGAAKLRRTLRALPDEITAEVFEELVASANAILADMVAAVPVDSGLLKQTLRVAINRRSLVARIGSFGGKTQRAPHAHLVEFGTASGPRRTGVGGTVYNHPGTAARPFMLPAYKKHRDEALRRIKSATVRTLDKASRS